MGVAALNFIVVRINTALPLLLVPPKILLGPQKKLIEVFSLCVLVRDTLAFGIVSTLLKVRISRLSSKETLINPLTHVAGAI